jgi:phage N-6-adenine-methyltransferase
MLRLRSDAELVDLHLPPHLLEQAKQQLAPQIPDVGDLRTLSDAELWTRVEQEHASIRRVEKEIVEGGLYLTAARYRRGVALLELKRRCGHGAFEVQCKARKIKSQRASEDMRLAEYFPSEAEAGKVPVRRALALIRGEPVEASSMSHSGGDPTNHDDEEIGTPVIQPAHRHNGSSKDRDNKEPVLGGETGDVLRPAIAADELHEPGRGLCEWNTPDWLFQLLDSEFHFTLDAAALPLNTKCKKFFTPQDDGRKQSWAGEVVWCNPPFNREVIGQWVQKGYEESQRGAVVVMVLPTPFKGYKWWGTYCTQGQVRFVHQFVTFTQSDGPRKARVDVTIIVFGQGYTGAGCPIVEHSPSTSAVSANPSDPSLRAILTTLLIKQPREKKPNAGVAGGGQTNGVQRKDRGGITARAIAGDGNYRQTNDFYPTPLPLVASLLGVEQFDGLTWEPAEGDGRIVQSLRQAGYEVFGSDVTTGTDFLKTRKVVDNIVTNPPWGQKTKFIRHARECACHKVALLLPLSALSGVARRPLFEDAAFRLRTVFVFDRRLNFNPEGKGSSTITGGWFVWERDYRGDPVLKWI